MNSSNQVIFKKPPLPSHIRPPPPPGYEQVKADVTFSTEGSKGNEASGAAQGSGGRRSRGRGMAEPRARAARHKGQLNFGNECMYLYFDVLFSPLSVSSHLSLTSDFGSRNVCMRLCASAFDSACLSSFSPVRSLPLALRDL